MVTGKITLDELKNQGNGLSIFSESKKEFTYNIGQQDHKVMVKMGEEGFTISIGNLVKDLNPEICQIKDKLFTIPCMVNNTNTQTLCNSGACRIDVVARTFLNKAIPKLQRSYRGNYISLANKSSVLPTEEVLLEIDISGEEEGTGLLYLMIFHQISSLELHFCQKSVLFLTLMKDTSNSDD